MLVETADVKILIDPGVSLAPLRFGLPPHPLEIRRMNELWVNIKERASRADVLIITHYHFDHFDPTEPLVFRDKTLLIKHPREGINASQSQRARELMRNLRTLPRRMELADGNRFDFGSTSIQFSGPVPHGPTAKVGWVVKVSVREGGQCFLYTSDIQGACRPEHMRFILAEKPDTIYMDGPLTYMIGQGFSLSELRASIQNIRQIIETGNMRTLILDHHLLRDPNWRDEVREIFVSAAEKGVKVVTAAGFLGLEDELLEAGRGRLFERFPDMPKEPLLRSKQFHLVRELQKISS